MGVVVGRGKSGISDKSKAVKGYWPGQSVDQFSAKSCGVLGQETASYLGTLIAGQIP
jgi:hypothetical protein